MITIQDYKNTNELPIELQGYQSIEVLECDSKTTKHGLLYYCILDGILAKIEYSGQNIYCLARLYRRNESIDRLLTLYENESALIDGFAPYSNSKYFIRNLFDMMEGQSFEKALLYVKQNIKKFQGTKRNGEKGRILRPEYGIIIGYEKPDIRRYSDNPKKNTFDVIDIVVKVTLHSNNDLKEWYQEENNRKNLINYALEKIQESKSYAKFNVPTDYLKLNSVGIGTDQYRLIFILKDDNSNHSTANI